MLRYILLDLGLFVEPGDRGDAEDTLLYVLESIVDRNCRYLRRHPGTPHLYDSGVTYAVPEQMAEARIDANKLDECEKYLKSIGASDDTVDAVMSFLQGIEVFRDIPTILKKGKVDCDNLAAWRAAELRRAGVRAMPYITWRDQDGGTTYHALVRWPDGTSEDPSLLLGMGGEAKATERAEEQRKNQERYEKYIEAAKLLVAQGQSAQNVSAQLDALALLPKGGWR